MMEEEDVLPKATGSTKWRRDEISRGQRKQRKEDHIRPEIQEHPPTVSRRIQNPEGFYSEDWDKDQQEDGECQIIGRKSHRWCFITESWRFIHEETELFQVSVLHTKGADVAHL